jgi:hypothetical protein
VDLSRLKWAKNIKPEHGWAYKLERGTPIAMEFPEAKIFGLNWKTKNKSNAERPKEGDFIVLHQHAKVTHIAEFLDNEVYNNISEPDWGIYRIVRAVWIPPSSKDWATLPHQNEMFGFNVSIWNGLARNLETPGRMSKFHQYWSSKGGLTAFQRHLATELAKIS